MVTQVLFHSLEPQVVCNHGEGIIILKRTYSYVSNQSYHTQKFHKRLATGIRPSTFEPAIRSTAAFARVRARNVLLFACAMRVSKYGELRRGARCLSSKYNT